MSTWSVRFTKVRETQSPRAGGRQSKKGGKTWERWGGPDSGWWARIGLAGEEWGRQL